MQKTITVADVDFTLATISMKVGREVLSGENATNSQLVKASLVAAGWTVDEATEKTDALPYFGDAFNSLLVVAREVNGLKEPGEAVAGATPASTGDTSTASLPSDAGTPTP